MSGPTMRIVTFLRDAAVFAPCYVVLDWASYIDPVGPFNITPWNPQPALAVVWMMFAGLISYGVSQTLNVPYHLPLPKEHRNANGDYKLSADMGTEGWLGRYFSKLDFAL